MGSCIFVSAWEGVVMAPLTLKSARGGNQLFGELANVSDML